MYWYHVIVSGRWEAASISRCTNVGIQYTGLHQYTGRSSDPSGIGLRSHYEANKAQGSTRQNINNPEMRRKAILYQSWYCSKLRIILDETFYIGKAFRFYFRKVFKDVFGKIEKL